MKHDTGTPSSVSLNDPTIGRRLGAKLTLVGVVAMLLPFLLMALAMVGILVGVPEAVKSTLTDAFAVFPALSIRMVAHWG